MKTETRVTGASLQPARDPRVDTLGRAAILTDTQFRLTFAPADPKAKLVALQANAGQDKLLRIRSQMRVGQVVVQLKAGFGEERSIVLDPPEILLLIDLFDRFVTELPNAE